MQTPKRAHWVLLGAVIVAGCLSPRADQSSFFVLTALTESESSGTAGAQLSVGVGPVTFPPYLERAQMVTRLGDHEFAINEYARWAEPLRANFTRSVVQNLGLLLGIDRVATYPWWNDRAPDYAITITVARFEPTAAGTVELWCTWEVSNAEGSTLLRERTRVSEPSTDDSAKRVAAMSRAVEQLSREIAQGMRRLVG